MIIICQFDNFISLQHYENYYFMTCRFVGRLNPCVDGPGVESDGGLVRRQHRLQAGQICAGRSRGVVRFVQVRAGVGSDLCM